MESWTDCQTKQVSFCHATICVLRTCGWEWYYYVAADAVQAFPIPQTKKQVKAFLGLTGYYRRFIPDYATIAVPLTDLTKKSAPNQVGWTQKCDTSFNRLKELLCSSPILQIQNFTLLDHLFCKLTHIKVIETYWYIRLHKIRSVKKSINTEKQVKWNVSRKLVFHIPPSFSCSKLVCCEILQTQIPCIKVFSASL